MHWSNLVRVANEIKLTESFESRELVHIFHKSADAGDATAAQLGGTCVRTLIYRHKSATLLTF